MQHKIKSNLNGESKTNRRLKMKIERDKIIQYTIMQFNILKYIFKFNLVI